MVPGGQIAREHDVSVEDAPHGIGDRLVVIVALDQDRVERGDAPAPAEGASPLEQSGQAGEDRRRIPFGGRRFPGRQTNLALGHGEAE